MLGFGVFDFLNFFGGQPKKIKIQKLGKTDNKKRK